MCGRSWKGEVKRTDTDKHRHKEGIGGINAYQGACGVGLILLRVGKMPGGVERAALGKFTKLV